MAALLVIAGRAFGLLITLTDSSAPAVRGALVAACLPAGVARLGLMRGYLAAGSCPGGAEPVAKVAEAFAGDVVDVESGWVAVNGARFANSRTAAYDSAGRSLHHVARARHGCSDSTTRAAGTRAISARSR
jgi:type IV secretory pathway protease TraF